MSSHPPKRKRGLPTAPQLLELLVWYRVLALLQALKVPVRRCVSCNSRLTNHNLGGNDGRSALTGPVWCLDCADYPLQLVLNFGGGS